MLDSSKEDATPGTVQESNSDLPPNSDFPSRCPIAICGFGLRLPGGIRTGDDFWDVLINGKDTRGPIPANRFNIDGFYSTQGDPGTIGTKHGYYLDDDLATSFDASFFSMSKAELERCDPQQRLLLEVARECLEDSGEVYYRGKRIGCYVGTFGEDWHEMSVKEPQDTGSSSVTGFLDMMLANRVSYEFDLRGPSMVIKTGCSASLIALHEACRALQAGDAEAALVGGTNLIMSPSMTARFTSEGVLSPDASCKTFDARADGYVRAEGITCVFLKRLDDALRDGNPIRAVIRGSGINSDGRSQSLMSPNSEAHEALMRSVYHQAGLSPRDTCLVECHGTGTAVGDPIETTAVGKVFGEYGVYITSVKPNVGHSEGCSGLTSLIKGILTLEHRMIPPNIKFEVPNPKIGLVEQKLRVPVRPTEFPLDRTERISINSFGIGGSNAHVIIESKAQSHSACLPTSNDHKGRDGSSPKEPSVQDHPLKPPNTPVSAKKRPSQIFFLSANSQPSLNQQVNAYEQYLRRQIEKDPSRLSDIAYTLATRREKLPHRSFLITHDHGEILRGPMPTRALTSAPRVFMVFSGQGAQWPAMGRDLIQSSPAFQKSLTRMDSILQNLNKPPMWSLVEEMQKSPGESRIHEAGLAQPLTTALQIAIFEQLKMCGVTAAAVVGHSSGEIAAAYAAGFVTLEYAMALAHYRGVVVDKCLFEEAGGMAVVGMCAADVEKFLSRPGVCVACENSPTSTTISGDREAIQTVLDSILERLPETFVRWLKVTTAYHSHHMALPAKQYLSLLGSEAAAGVVSNDENIAELPVFMSSVTRKKISAKADLVPEYWVSNLTSPVRFSTAASDLMAILDQQRGNTSKNQTLLLEVGPHATLAGPLREICAARNQPYQYINCQTRNENSVVGLMSAFGRLFQQGVDLNLDATWPRDSQAIGGLPPYAWDHSGPAYWHESRLSSAWRLRKFPHHGLLGSRVVESTDSRPLWRNVLHLDTVPWLSDHKIGQDVVFPFVGYIAMAVEARRQAASTDFKGGYRLRNVTVSAALVLTHTKPAELVTTLSVLGDYKSSFYDFTISSFTGEVWVKHCGGQVSAQDASCGQRLLSEVPQSVSALPRGVPSARLYESMAAVGLNYGPKFQLLSNITSSTTDTLAEAELLNPQSTGPHGPPLELHPASMDACIQLLLVANVKGLCRNFTQVVMPVKIDEIEVSPHFATSSLQARAGRARGDEHTAFAQCTAASGEIAFRASGLKLTPLDVEDDDDKETDAHAAAALHWLPDFDFADVAGLLDVPVRDSTQTMLEDRLTLLCILESADKVAGRTPSQPHFEKYRSWLDLQITEARNGQHALLPNAAELVALPRSQRLEELDRTLQELRDKYTCHSLAEAVNRVSDNACEIFDGGRDALDLLTKDNVLSDLYGEFSFGYGEFVRLLSHKRPNLRILEVGAGTGGTTERTLRNLMSQSGVCSYATYVFTDISAGFFPHAKRRLDYARNLEFAVLDISQDPLAQGFDAASYDLILAANVVHATPSLQVTLRNLEILLKPDGILLLTEMSTVTKASNYLFGNFSGWWLGEDDGREWEPFVTPSRWDQELKAAGFTGAERVVADGEDPFQVCVTIMARSDRQSKSRQPKSATPGADAVTLLCDSTSSAMTQMILSSLRIKYGANKVSLCRLQDAVPADRDIIACIGLEKLFFGETMTETSFLEFQGFIRHLKDQRVLWLTRRFQIECQDPRSAQTLGVARTLRSELGLRFFTFEVDPSEPQLARLALNVFEKIRFVEDDRTLDADREYVVKGGSVHVGRFHPFNLVDKVRAAAVNNTARSISEGELGVFLSKPGRLDTLQWRQQPTTVSSAADIAENEVEIDVRVVGLNFKDVLLATGVLQTPKSASGGYGPECINLGIEASGIVRRVGSSSSGLKPGDRVMVLSPTSTLRSRITIPAALVVAIPDSLCFEAAATIPLCFATVMYSLLEAARLKHGQSVLIHSACGGVGLAALQVCKMIGAEAFCTVDASNEDKVHHLINRYGIPRNRIFSSRDKSFAAGVLRESGGRGVDVVLNSLAGELLHESWRCVADYGTMVELGKRDLEASERLDMTPFLANRAYVGVDLQRFIEDRPMEVGRWLTRFLELYEQGLLQPLEPTTCFDAPALEQAFRHLQNASHIGKVIVSLSEESMQQISVPDVQYSGLLSGAEATYLLVGGTTGLGASLATWLAENGARNLLFLSRSSGVSRESQLLFTELESMGCCVTAVAGSVNNPEDVQRAVEKTKTPIKGVFHLAMILDDSSFLDMDWAQWQTVADVKVQGAWNLHRSLSSHSLEFFWMASSVITIVDQAGQANYSAACSFLEAFCQYRHSLGLPTSVVNICPIDGVGYVAKNARAKRSMIAQGLFFLSEREFLDFVKLQLLESKPEQALEKEKTTQVSATARPRAWRSLGQVVAGLRSASEAQAGYGLDDANNKTNWRRDRRMGAYHNARGRTHDGPGKPSTETDASPLVQFLARFQVDPGVLADSDTVGFLAQEIGAQMLSFMLRPDSEIDVGKSLSHFGLDSLMALELRRWFRHVFGLSISVLEIVASGTLLQLGEVVRAKLAGSVTMDFEVS